MNSESSSTPRISAPYLGEYRNQRVSIVGKVVQIRGEEVQLDAEGIVTIQIPHKECHLIAGNGAYVIGKVSEDLTVKSLTTIDLGDGVDYNLANSVAEIVQQHKGIHSF